MGGMSLFRLSSTLSSLATLFKPGAGLMAVIEDLARARSVTTLHVQSSITAEGFYKKLGYVAVNEKFHGAERTIMMEKHLDGERSR